MSVSRPRRSGPHVLTHEENLSDRILVIYEGEIVGEFDPKKTTVEELGLYMAGAKKQGEAKA